MAQRRIKSFSPYTYNVSYRKPGEKPIIGRRTYIPNAGYSHPEYVVTKIEEKIQPPPKPIVIPSSIYFTYVNNTFFYLINDNCEVEFIKYSSNFEFISKNIDQYHNYEKFETYNLKYTYKTFYKKDFEQIFSNEIRINHNLNAIIDFIVLLNDEYFLDYSYVEEDLGNVKIKFNLNVDLNYVKIIIYQVFGDKLSINRFKYNIIKPNDDNFSYDDLNKRFKIRNIFGTTQLKLKINSIIDNQIKQYKSINITPSYIFFDKDEVINLNDLQQEKTEIENQQFSDDQLLLVRYNTINQQIEQLLHKNNYGIDIKTIEIYYSTENREKKYIQFGHSNQIINWTSDNTNYYIDINHSLDGYVNYLIDNDEFKNINYKMIYVSRNKIRMILSKNDQIPLSFSLSLFKIGENTQE